MEITKKNLNFQKKNMDFGGRFFAPTKFFFSDQFKLAPMARWKEHAKLR
jgi:hypothetical protein